MLTNIDCRALSAVCWQNALKILLVCALFGKVLSAEFPLEIVDNSGTKVLLPKSPEAYQAYRLSELLPESFGPENLS